MPPHVGVRLQFFTNRRRLSVAGVDLGVGGQGEQLLADGTIELLRVAVGKVRAADAPLKQHVAAEDDARLLVLGDEDDVAGAVAGRFPD